MAGEADGYHYMVMDLVEGRPLAAELHQPRSEKDIVLICRGIASALATIHRHGVVHRDVRPAHIVLRANRGPCLIHLGLASRLAMSEPDTPLEMPFYAAPEQTGLLPRPVDGRTDLYALGLVMFECAAGRPPFVADDLAELMRLHAVEPAPNLAALAPQVSPAFAAITAKLLEKDPDDRYQRAEGLLADLQRLPELNRALEIGPAVQFGSDDSSQPGQDAPPLVGREVELGSLRQAWHDARRRRGGVVVVEGEPGMGKSRLVSEFLQTLSSTDALLLTGRGSATVHAPFAALRAAFAGLVRDSERQPSARREALAHEIRSAIGGNEQVIQQAAPALCRLIGRRPQPAPNLPVGEQYPQAVGDFLRRLGHRRGGLCLFLDDAQWLGGSTKRVLRSLVAGIHRTRLLVVLTARNDLPNRPALTRLLTDLGEGQVRRIQLGDLPERAASELIQNELGGQEVDADIVRAIASRGNGNPYALREYVRAMLDAGVLRPWWGTWALDTDELGDLDLPGDVLEVVLQRTQELRAETRWFLGAAAVVGPRFRLDLLADVCGASPQDVRQAMSEAMHARLVEHVEDGHYAFFHDRIREALLSHLNPDVLRQLHQNVAHALEHEGTTANPYSLAHHYAQGDVGRHSVHAYGANVAAGLLALRESASDTARFYLERAKDIAEEHGLSLDVDLLRGLGESYSRTGQVEPAVTHLHRALPRCANPVERARLHLLTARAFASGWRHGHVWDELEPAFRELRIPWPRSAPGQLALALWYWHGALALHWLGLHRRRLNDDQRDRFTVEAELLDTTWAWSVLCLKPFHGLLAIGRGLFVAHLLGPSVQLSSAYSQASVFFAALRQRQLSNHFLKLARSLDRRLTDRVHLARTDGVEVIALTHLGDTIRPAELARRCFAKNDRWLDPNSLQYVNGTLIWNLLFRGYFQECLEWIEHLAQRVSYRPIIDSEPQGDGVPNYYTAAVLAALGRLGEAREQQRFFREQMDRFPVAERGLLLNNQFYSYGLLYYIELGEVGADLDGFIEAHDRLNLPRRVPVHMQSFHILQAYARLAQVESCPASERPRRLNQLARSHRELRRVARIPIVQSHERVIAAARARLSGHRRRARRALHQAQELADRIDSPWIHAEVAREKALWLKGKHPGAVQSHADMALALARRHGWVQRERRLRVTLDLTDEPSGNLNKATPATGLTSPGLKLQRHLHALRDVSLASAAILEPQEQAGVVMEKVLQLMGAERALLFSPTDGEEQGAFHFLAGRTSSGRTLTRAEGHFQEAVDRVVHTGKPVVMTDLEGQAKGPDDVLPHGLRSVVAVPLLLQRQLRGVLYLDNRRARGAFSEDDVEILQAVANHVAIAMESARAARFKIRLQSTEQKRALAESLREVALSLGATLDQQEVLERCVEGAERLVRFKRASLYVIDQQQLVLAASRGEAEELAGPAEQRLDITSAPFLYGVLQRKEPLAMADLRTAHDFPEGADVQRSRSWLGVPLLHRDEPLGVMVFEDDVPRAYRQDQIEIAQILAAQLSIAIQNARLFSKVERLASVDELTSALNRRQFQALAGKLCDRAVEAGQPVCAVMFDLDHFKRVNDTHGHAAGDAVLREVARRCRSALRETDLFARYGGEEFALLLPNQQLPAAERLAERLRRVLADEPIPTAVGALHITASFGVAQAFGPGGTIDGLLELADEALYRAKEAGRNRVAAAPPPTTPPRSVPPQKEAERDPEKTER
jgi:diguanylate cyclase (GGDEF)-like protein